MRIDWKGIGWLSAGNIAHELNEIEQEVERQLMDVPKRRRETVIAMMFLARRAEDD